VRLRSLREWLPTRPDLRVFLGYGLELHVVVEPFSDSIRPCTELLAVPLEAVVAMTELTSGKRLELCVVFRVRSREDDSCRSGELEQDSLECCEPGFVQMLNDLNNGSSIESGESFVPIHQ